VRLYKDILQMTLPSRQKGRVRQDLDAYLAGFFDGEGHVYIAKNTKREWSYYVAIGAAQVNREPLELLVSAYGGKVYEKKRGPRQQACGEWRCSGKDALYALYRMLPWLTVKRSKARVAIILLQNRPLTCAGGQISPHQKMAITKALKGVTVVKING
jgi:hypothetical protein